MKRFIPCLMLPLVTLVSCQKTQSPVETETNSKQVSLQQHEPKIAEESADDRTIRRLIQRLASRDRPPRLVGGSGLGGGIGGFGGLIDDQTSEVNLVTPEFSEEQQDDSAPNAVDTDINLVDSPFRGGGHPYVAVYPNGFDHSHRNRVHKTSKELVAYGKQAIPHLIASRNDSRYCRTASTSDDVNISVGVVCWDILGWIVEDFPSRRSYKSMPSYVGHILRGDEEQWWEEHKHMTLREIQIEALKWTIDAEQNHDESHIKFWCRDRATFEKTIIEPLKQDLATLESRTDEPQDR